MKTGGLKQSISILSFLGALICCSSCGADAAVPVYDASDMGTEQSVDSQSLAETEIEEVPIEPEQEDEMPFGAGVFSWERLPSASDIRCMRDNGITELYQYLKPEYSFDEVITFLKLMSENEIDVYILDGEPEWSYEEEYQGMKNVLDKVRTFNSDLNRREQIKGIVLDVEPYVLDKWHSTPRQLLDEYTANVVRLKEDSKDAEFELQIYVCIPYSYDLMGHDKVLRTLIKETDGVMVLNYNKGNEAANIKREAALARWYKKRLVNVYELQPGLLSQTNNSITYYNDGIEAVKENYKNLLDEYPSHNIALAYHTLDYVKVLSMDK